MNRLKTHGLGLAILLGMMVLTAGCAKKAAEAPPTPPPAPAQPAPAPAPTPKEETPPAPTPSPISSSDFEPAFFDFDSYSLRNDAQAALDHDAKLLRDHPDINITIEGHCDERGTVEYNQALGQKRAEAARDYVVAAGISASRIEVVSYGKERPFDPGHDENAWAKNRRAHFVVR
jgi:peptidoglycan-associated lipoprotein